MKIKFGRGAIGWFETGQPWRQLEQQRQEHAIGEPEQEHAGQPEQQPGLPSQLPERSLCIGISVWGHAPVQSSHYQATNDQAPAGCQ
jgi:hypothetical protein